MGRPLRSPFPVLALVVTGSTLGAGAGACSPTPQFGSDTTSTTTTTTTSSAASSGGRGGAGGTTTSSTSTTATSSSAASSSTGGGTTVASSSAVSSSGTTCTPKTCALIGAECGSASDGCTGTLECGACTQPNYACGIKTPNQCGCVPQTCTSLGANCGSVSDGCGNMIPCGACMGATACGAGGKANVCDVALSTSCGPCAGGYQNVSIIYDQVCYPAYGCMAQPMYDEICYRGPGMATVFCGGSCPSQTHPGGSYPSCSCATDLFVCIPDPP